MSGAIKSKNVVFRVDPGTYRQIEAEAQRRGLSVSAYARLMTTLPFVEAGPPAMRPLDPEIKEAIATIEASPELPLLERLQALKPAIETVMAAQSSLDAAARWLVNVTNGLIDLSAKTPRSHPDASSGDKRNPDPPASR
jgi:hypothetical protein